MENKRLIEIDITSGGLFLADSEIVADAGKGKCVHSANARRRAYWTSRS
jgi:hypothetical protein